MLLQVASEAQPGDALPALAWLLRELVERDRREAETGEAVQAVGRRKRALAGRNGG